MAWTETDLSSMRLPLGECVNDDATLNAAGALTYAEGTILGRITASGKLTYYSTGATGGAGSDVPVAVLETAYTFTGAGDKAARPIVFGKVRKEKLVVHGVGAPTVAQCDALRSYGIVPLAAVELGITE